jgi:hypothetical protein
MWWDRERWWAVFVPPVTAGVLMVLFFAVTDRWHNLENPVASQVALFCGLLGVAAGIAAQRIREWVWLALPGIATVGVALWAYFQPHKTPNDEDFRQILAVLAFILALTTIAINLPQFLRGRYR